MNDTLEHALEHEIERWWPRLSIEAKHRILADLGAELDPLTCAEIEALVGAPAPKSLTAAERMFIITQMEAVD